MSSTAGYLKPGHYCLKHYKHSKSGKIFWHHKKVEEFAKTYCAIEEINPSIKDSIVYTMYCLFERNGVSFSKDGVPEYMTTEKPVPVQITWLR